MEVGTVFDEPSVSLLELLTVGVGTIFDEPSVSSLELSYQLTISGADVVR